MSARNAISNLLMTRKLMTSKLMMAVCFTAALAMMSTSAVAQNFGGSVVGGVSIDANGVLTGEVEALPDDLRAKLVKDLQSAHADVNDNTEIRVVSMKGLNAQLLKAKADKSELPPEVRYMAGLQRIEYIILSPETNDILVAGPAEGWKINAKGNVVGKTTDMPVIQVQDFLVAMRTVENAGRGQGISVSIDPTEEGVQNFTKFTNALNAAQRVPISTLEAKGSEAMGPQTISLTGIPKDSRFSQVLVAADYKMKRLAMGLEESKLDNMPSIFGLANKKNGAIKNASPRFWMECKYDSVAKTKAGDVWQIRGQGVKTLTEDSFFNKQGERKVTGKSNKFAQQWADSMTERFEDLSKVEPVFRELRNMMDMSVAAAIIAREGLLEEVGLEIPGIMGKEVSTPAYPVPKQIPAQCSFVKMKGKWFITASGGVQVDSWGVAAKTEVAKIEDVATTALKKTSDRWWWNAEKIN